MNYTQYNISKIAQGLISPIYKKMTSSLLQGHITYHDPQTSLECLLIAKELIPMLHPLFGGAGTPGVPS